MTASPLSRPLRLAFYGDDFTGSTDALEVLAFGGLRCALFLSVPTSVQMAALGGFDAIGVAGASRAMSPDEMDLELPAVLSGLAALAPQIRDLGIACHVTRTLMTCDEDKHALAREVLDLADGLHRRGRGGAA